MNGGTKGIPVVMAADENYAWPLLVAVSSLLRNADRGTRYDLHLLLHGDFAEKSLQRIREVCLARGNCSLHPMRMEDGFVPAESRIPHISAPTFYRLRLPSLLPDVGKCIYLDTDVVVCGDLSGLHGTELGGCCLAGVRAISFYSFPSPNAGAYHARRLGLPDMEHYVNAGVLLMDLGKMREGNLEERFEEALGRGYDVQDQDVLNVVCAGHVANLPFRYNVMTKYPVDDDTAWSRSEGLQRALPEAEWDEGRKNPVVIHFADAIKPWNDAYSPLAFRWWKELLQTDGRTAGSPAEAFLEEMHGRNPRGNPGRTAVIELKDARGTIDGIQIESPVPFRKSVRKGASGPAYRCEAGGGTLDFSVRRPGGTTLEVQLGGLSCSACNARGETRPLWIHFRSFAVNGEEMLKEPVLCSGAHPRVLRFSCGDGAKCAIHAEWEEGDWGIRDLRRKIRLLREKCGKGNRIDIGWPVVTDGKRIDCEYRVAGKWKKAFRNEKFSVEYGCDISSVPAGVLVIPFLANILPIAWVCNAEIRVPVCDRDFYGSIAQFKRGYERMHPGMEFGGKLVAETLQENRPADAKGAVAFFSGGVDAFFTLIRHREEKPDLVTLWGADVKLDDEDSWRKVRESNLEVGRAFGVECRFVKSRLRTFLDRNVLDRLVRKSGDAWWHGFQHGIGIIAHAAPIVHALGKKRVYIASTFTAADKGKYTCASDPSIDNAVRFCGAEVVHDGYECNRVDKIRGIVRFSEETGIPVPLRVCYSSRGGGNCCHCEKCWRTILGIYAVGGDPRKFGFSYGSLEEVGREIKRNRHLIVKNFRYGPIWKALRKNRSLFSVEPSLRWFYLGRMPGPVKDPFWKRGARKLRKLAGKARAMLESRLFSR
ncbi:MAG: glycosyltransferase family 8 protein [Kiritimatiellae bacterium]|nr:glycosyltransferase family 8 protein [Kiritimatiellia bacterium]